MASKDTTTPVTNSSEESDIADAEGTSVAPNISSSSKTTKPSHDFDDLIPRMIESKESSSSISSITPPIRLTNLSGDVSSSSSHRKRAVTITSVDPHRAPPGATASQNRKSALIATLNSSVGGSGSFSSLGAGSSSDAIASITLPISQESSAIHHLKRHVTKLTEQMDIKSDLIEHFKSANAKLTEANKYLQDELLLCKQQMASQTLLLIEMESKSVLRQKKIMEDNDKEFAEIHEKLQKDKDQLRKDFNQKCEELKAKEDELQKTQQEYGNTITELSTKISDLMNQAAAVSEQLEEVAAQKDVIAELQQKLEESERTVAQSEENAYHLNQKLQLQINKCEEMQKDLERRHSK